MGQINREEAYGIYTELLDNKIIHIETNSLNKDNINNHFFHILNIMRDYIETDMIRNLRIVVHYADGINLKLSLFDYWFNNIFWTIPTFVDEPITSEYLFYPEGITKKEIKKYIDKFLIRKYRDKISFIALNNIIDDAIYKFKFINEFALYLANTVNLEDTLYLMKKYPEFNEAIHPDLTNISLEDAKSVGMKYANTQIEYIKNSEDHCLKPSFLAKEAINPKQFKEVNSNIGTKPDGRGGVFPHIINKSFINGGVSDIESYLIDSSVGRTAQILQKMNVGTSGNFARLLGLNNMDTIFHPDPNYSCNTHNYEEVTIIDDTWLSIYDMRYYKFKEDGPLYLLDASKDKHLIGKKLYFRSPMTCESHARGHGICRKCYGDLYYINKDINPGKLASELLSAIYTQILLSAKHLLESDVIKMKWTEGFEDVLEINMNSIILIDNFNYKGFTLIIDQEFIEYEDSDDEDLEYNEYVTVFEIRYPKGETIKIHTKEFDPIYFTKDLNKIMLSKKTINKDGKFYIPMDKIESTDIIFMMHIQNKELSRTLEKSKRIIDKAEETEKYDRNSILNTFIQTNLEGNLGMNAVHYEVLLANQMRSAEDELEMPSWTKPNAPYKICTLGRSLMNNPSITITLEYQRIARTLVSPISSRKTKPSVIDLYFKEQPQDLMGDNGLVSDDYKMRDDNDTNVKPLFHFYDNNGNEISN